MYFWHILQGPWPLWVCVCVLVVQRSLFVSLVFVALHLSSAALYSSCSNCRQADCSSLDAMEAVIGRAGHNDQCRRYYRVSRHPGAPDGRALAGAKGEQWGEKESGEDPQLVISVQETGRLLVDEGVYWQLACPTCICSLRPALWHLLPPQNLSARSHPSLTSPH